MHEQLGDKKSEGPVDEPIFKAACFDCKIIAVVPDCNYLNRSSKAESIIEKHTRRRRGHHVLVANVKNLEVFSETAKFLLVSLDTFFTRQTNIIRGGGLK